MWLASRSQPPPQGFLRPPHFLSGLSAGRSAPLAEVQSGRVEASPGEVPFSTVLARAPSRGDAPGFLCTSDETPEPDVARFCQDPREPRGQVWAATAEGTPWADGAVRAEGDPWQAGNTEPTRLGPHPPALPAAGGTLSVTHRGLANFSATLFLP